MGVSIWLLRVETKICPPGHSTTPQHSSLTFGITFNNLINNHYKWSLEPNATIRPNSK
jgi:hypothetical protein